MNFAVIALVFLLLAIYLSANYYIGKRIYKNISYSFRLNPFIYWGIFGFFAVFYILARMVEGWLPYGFAKILVPLSSYWIVFFFYGLLFFAVLDGIGLLDRKIDFLPEKYKYRKDNRFLITVLVLVTIFSLMIWGSFNAKNLTATSYVVETEKALSRGYRVALISDLHISYQIGYQELEKIIQEVNGLLPDVILIAGDIFDGDWRTFFEEDINSLLGTFNPGIGTYAVLGNHDNFMENRPMLRPILEANGITLLKDEAALVNGELLIIGRKDITENRTRYGMEERLPLGTLLEEPDKQKYLILMDHSPLDIYEAAARGVDLHVAGHTHGGQMYPFGLLTERAYAFDYGQLIKDSYHLIVSSGAGTWGPPVRIGTRSEVVLIEIRRK